MQIEFRRMRIPTLVASLSGDALILNGVVFDFASLPEGATLSRAAIDCVWLASDVVRLDGVIRITLNVPEEHLEESTILATDGPLPGLDGDAPATTQPGSVDWSLVITAEAHTAHLLSATKTSCRASAFAALSTKAEAITGHVPQAERDSWSTKAAAARAWLVDAASPDQSAMLLAEATIMNEALEDLAPVIVAKADAYSAVAARLAGLRRQVTTAIDAALTPEDAQAALVALNSALAGLGDA